jgi:Fur family zinc uptake transcriptional regulator
MSDGMTILPDSATRAASDQGISLTETRRKVFELVIKAGQPIGAYRLLEAMQDKGSRVMPPTVYRALNFLQGKGLVHRIESLNAFVACTPSGHEHGQFLICSECGRTEELADESVSAMMRERAKSRGFTLTQPMIELKGLCADCTG